MGVTIFSYTGKKKAFSNIHAKLKSVFAGSDPSLASEPSELSASCSESGLNLTPSSLSEDNSFALKRDKDSGIGSYGKGKQNQLFMTDVDGYSHIDRCESLEDLTPEEQITEDPNAFLSALEDRQNGTGTVSKDEMRITLRHQRESIEAIIDPTGISSYPEKDFVRSKSSSDTMQSADKTTNYCVTNETGEGWVQSRQISESKINSPARDEVEEADIAESANEYESDIFDSDESETELEKEELQPGADKRFNVVLEMMQTEETYIKKLAILDGAKTKATEILKPVDTKEMFPYIEHIPPLHHDFLESLKSRLKIWHTNRRIGDLRVVKDFGHYLRHYKGYLTNFSDSAAFVQKWRATSPDFAKMLDEVTAQNQGGKLDITSFMLEPIQRIPRYILLFQQYLKYLDVNEVDERQAMEAALKAVTEAATYLENAIEQKDQIGNLLDLQKMIVDVEIISDDRIFKKRGSLRRVGRKFGTTYARHVFLFNDMLLICKAGTLFKSSYYKEEKMPMKGLDVITCDRPNYPFSIIVRNKAYEAQLVFDSEDEKMDWFKTISEAIKSYRRNMKSRKKEKHSLSAEDEPDTDEIQDIDCVFESEVKKSENLGVSWEKLWIKLYDGGKISFFNSQHDTCPVTTHQLSESTLEMTTLSSLILLCINHPCYTLLLKTDQLHQLLRLVEGFKETLTNVKASFNISREQRTILENIKEVSDIQTRAILENSTNEISQDLVVFQFEVTNALADKHELESSGESGIASDRSEHTMDGAGILKPSVVEELTSNFSRLEEGNPKTKSRREPSVAEPSDETEQDIATLQTENEIDITNKDQNANVTETLAASSAENETRKNEEHHSIPNPTLSDINKNQPAEIENPMFPQSDVKHFTEKPSIKAKIAFFEQTLKLKQTNSNSSNDIEESKVDPPRDNSDAESPA